MAANKPQIDSAVNVRLCLLVKNHLYVYVYLNINDLSNVVKHFVLLSLSALLQSCM